MNDRTGPLSWMQGQDCGLFGFGACRGAADGLDQPSAGFFFDRALSTACSQSSSIFSISGSGPRPGAGLFCFATAPLRAISKEHLHCYVADSKFPYNTCDLYDGVRTEQAIRQADGKQLMYKDSVHRAG